MIKTKGINHIALVCRDMKETMQFYTKVLQMPLIKTVELPDGGQHFFFDCGGGNAVAFFWWKDAPPAAPGIASVKDFPSANIKSAIGSMNHLAFHVEEVDLDGIVERLDAAGIAHLPAILNHDDSPGGYAPKMHEGVFVRSVYFVDPNGILLEYAANTREFGPEDIAHEPATADMAETV